MGTSLRYDTVDSYISEIGFLLRVITSTNAKKFACLENIWEKLSHQVIKFRSCIHLVPQKNYDGSVTTLACGFLQYSSELSRYSSNNYMCMTTCLYWRSSRAGSLASDIGRGSRRSCKNLHCTSHENSSCRYIRTSLSSLCSLYMMPWKINVNIGGPIFLSLFEKNRHGYEWLQRILIWLIDSMCSHIGIEQQE